MRYMYFKGIRKLYWSAKNVQNNFSGIRQQKDARNYDRRTIIYKRISHTISYPDAESLIPLPVFIPAHIQLRTYEKICGIYMYLV